jgi:hypothetical protein
MNSEKKKTLNQWIEDFKGMFDGRQLEYMNVHKAMIQIQLKDSETGIIELHNFDYTAKDAVNLKVEGIIS